MRVFISALLLLGVCFAGCENEECIDESKISNGPCTKEYMPVCGCDGKTYGNKCEADRAGVTSYNTGACTGS